MDLSLTARLWKGRMARFMELLTRAGPTTWARSSSWATQGSTRTRTRFSGVSLAEIAMVIIRLRDCCWARTEHFMEQRSTGLTMGQGWSLSCRRTAAVFRCCGIFQPRHRTPGTLLDRSFKGLTDFFMEPPPAAEAA